MSGLVRAGTLRALATTGAQRSPLLPDVPTERIHFVGNAASSGAQMILLSQQCREKSKELARKIEYVEIAHQPEFQTVFADCMAF